MNKKSLKKVIVLLMLLVLFIAVSIYGYFYFQREQSDFHDYEEMPKVQVVNEDSSNRAYAVMINNLGVARPYHSGLQDAYLVYEMIVEGGITRYLALFHDKSTERIGPIRSARPYYLDYVMENDAYFVHWGFSEQAKSDISKFAIQNINGLYQDQYFWKDTSLKVSTEHTAFTSMDKLQNASNELGFQMEREKDFLFHYSVEDVNFGENALLANRVIIPYSKGTVTSYVYDPEKKVYQRFVNDEAHIDYVSKEQYVVKNIITYQVKNRSIDSYGRQELSNTGQGDGYYISNGMAIPIKWSKKTRESQTVYTMLDGSEIQVNDGNTWIQIQPDNQEISILE